MRIPLKPIREQVMVITGASSGIGLVTARIAASRGASVVLAARNERDLREATENIRRRGGRAMFVVADVSDLAQVERIADATVREFGRIDTWVNNAAVSMYGRIMEIAPEDMRRQFDVNYWGQVYGSRTAVRHMRERGGAVINVASALADRAIPLQGNYCAAKHAIKAFTDALRMELEADGVPISVSLVKPASIDTPFFDKAKTYLGVEPQPVPPVYAPEIAAKAIIACAQRPIRDVIVGGSGKMLSVADRLPRLADKYMEWKLFDAQQTDTPTASRPDNLYTPVMHDGGERGGNWDGRTKSTSLYTAGMLHPRTALGALGAALGAITVFSLMTRSGHQA